MKSISTNKQERIAKHLVASAVLLAAMSASAWGQSTAPDPHHPAAPAASAPAADEQANIPATQPQAAAGTSQGGGRDLMNEMQAMPAHDHSDHGSCCTLKKKGE